MKSNKKLKLGDHVVYPMHGVGKVSDIASTTILGKEVESYTIQLLNNQMNVIVPVDKVQETGLRQIIQKKEVPKILKLLEEGYDEEFEEWKARYQHNLEKLKTGSIISAAEVTRNLYKRANGKKLSIMEKKLYEVAYHMLVNEIAISKSISLEQANNLISDILSR